MDRAISEPDDIFCDALELTSPAERAAYLDRACGDDAGLRRRVERLLEAHAEADRFLAAGPSVAAATPAPAAEAGGTVIGPYKLVEVIGEGGMGTVWLAQQTEPVKRLVAFKVIKAGMDSRQVVARFEQERQALALMDHPHIAHILDGGATASGRPYFVMELVKGAPITDFCDQNHLPVRQRLELFVSVCQAVQHAHTKGIIHRDLKPSNVLVAAHDGTPVVKVIDFGIAKALGQQLTDKTLVTGGAQLIGTPLYMSPEQAQLGGLDIDTRSDVYALGVLLYELLTGTTPFDAERLRTVGFDEIRRIIREEEPARPSTRVSTLGQAGPTASANRRSDPRRLSRLLRGELDWVVMTCLEKDRNRRYETANGLARDLQRYLADEPVLACPPGTGYRLWKFARRNRRALTTLGLLGAMLLATAGSLGWALRDREARQADEERDRAARETETDREVDRALQEAALLRDHDDWPGARAAVQRAEWLLAGGGGDANRQRMAELRRDLDMAARLEEVRLRLPTTRKDPSADAEVGRAYAAAFRDYGIDVLALGPAEAAERIRASAIRGPLVAALDDWVWAAEMERRKYPLTRMTGLLQLRPLLKKEGPAPADQPPAEAPRRDPLRDIARLADPDDLRNRLRDDAARGDRRALEDLAARPEAATLPPSTAVLLAQGLRSVGATDRAVAVLDAAQQRSPSDFRLNHELAQLLEGGVKPPRPEEAAGYARAALAVRPLSPALHAHLGKLLLDAGHPEPAIAAYRRSLDLKPDQADACNGLGRALGAGGRWDEAVTAHARAVELDPNSGAAHLDLAWAYRMTRAPAKAIAEYKAAVRLWESVDVQVRRFLDFPRGPAYRELAWMLATCADPELRDPAGALAAAKAAVAAGPRDAEYLRVLGTACYRAGDWDGAVAALATSDKLQPSGNPYIWVFLAMAHWQKGDRAQARAWYDRTVRCLEERRAWIDGDPLVKEELPRFRAEAAQLLGIADSPSPAAEEAPPKKP